VVIIVSIKNLDGGTQEVTLSDGWYCIKAQLDLPLSRFLALGKLFAGQKLHICGSEVLSYFQNT
jgi:breast cancer 2 susceptibility protein